MLLSVDAVGFPTVFLRCRQLAAAGVLFWYCLCLSVCDHVLKIFEHSILQAAWGNLAKFTTRIQFWIQ